MFGQTSNLGTEQSRGILTIDGKWVYPRIYLAVWPEGRRERGLGIQETCGS